MSKQNWKVSPLIEGLYEVVNTSLPILESKIGRVDLRRITPDQAEEIVKRGTRYLRKIERKVSKKETPTD